MAAAQVSRIAVALLCACAATAFVPAKEAAGEHMFRPPIPLKPHHFGIKQVNRKVHKDIQLGVNYNTIPNTDLAVSQLCMGTATFGQQVTDDDAHKILDMACNTYGINFIDTAEFFPHPKEIPEDFGASEEIVGDWLKKQKRESFIIADRVASFSDVQTIMRGGEVVRASRKHIKQGVEASLKRLQTDYIDLLYLGWPDRYVTNDVQPIFDPTSTDHVPISFEEQVETMNELIKEGKIRHYGVANETPWGIAQWHRVAEKLGLKPPVAASNPYNLLNRNFVETHLVEAIYHANMSFIGYSPLCEGVLTCKYLDTTEKVEGRLHTLYGHQTHLLRENVETATFAHKMVAEKRFIPLHAWAINYCMTRPFVTSTCIGVTNLEQLKDAILSQNVNIPEIPYGDEDIELIYRKFADPTRGEYHIPSLKQHLENRKPLSDYAWDSRIEYRTKRDREDIQQMIQRFTPDESSEWYDPDENSLENTGPDEYDDEFHQEWDTD